ncbi:kinase [Moumouvirus goulette]|uniref:Kinase n=1 Tax=Moumouvirus goulette TaxID=1247379 RepID=M1PH78_9VIRU|nr:kinase [Moumouvirus goulette]AGF85408.1 kinase [Moumouvirus goulette]
MDLFISIILSILLFFGMKIYWIHNKSDKKILKHNPQLNNKIITKNLQTESTIQTKNKENDIINNMIEKFIDIQNLSLKTPYVIGICGGSGSGKTFITKLICETINKMFTNETEVVVISQDSYYIGGNSETNYDIPEAIDFELLIQHLEILKNNEPIDCPIYDFITHSRKQETIHVNPSKIIIVEGILIFTQEHLRNLLNMKIFISADEPTQIFRRTIRDVNERGRDIHEVQLRVTRDVWPSYKTHVLPSSIYADISINNFNECYVGPQIVLSHIINIFKSLSD